MDLCPLPNIKTHKQMKKVSVGPVHTSVGILITEDFSVAFALIVHMWTQFLGTETEHFREDFHQLIVTLIRGMKMPFLFGLQRQSFSLA